jgi:hypothetical protein
MGYTSKYADDNLNKHGGGKKKATPQDVQKKKYAYHYNKNIEKQKNAGGTGRGIGSMLKAQKAAEKVTNIKVMRGRK